MEIIIESRRVGEDVFRIRATGRYMVRGQRARLQYDWVPDEAMPERVARETIDWQWAPDGKIERAVRTVGNNRMEFKSGVETEVSYMTPAGILPMRIRTEGIQMQREGQRMCLQLQYVLNVSDEEEKMELKIFYCENN